MDRHMDVRTLINLIRLFLRDNPKLNVLIKKEETDDDVIKLAINMAISDWNSTPPLLAPVRLESFPVFDWLIVASCMFILQSSGVLQYRNELQYSDGGITVNPWSKGPAYTTLAGMWAERVERTKTQFKIACNYARTFGIVRSPEYMLWDYSGLYTGPDYLTATNGGEMSALPGGLDGSGGVEEHHKKRPNRTPPFMFSIGTWVVNPITNMYEINFPHNLNSDVDVRITDPTSGKDLRSQCSIQFANTNLIVLSIPLVPDTRFAGQAIAFKL